MAKLLLAAPSSQATLLAPAALGLLAHTVSCVRGGDQALCTPDADLFVIDGRSDLAGARAIAQLLHAAGITQPTLLLIPDTGLPTVSADWFCRDFIVDSATPAEWEARLRLLLADNGTPATIIGGPIVIDEAAYTVTLAGEPLDLTYTEFELLKHLVQHPGRVLTREQLLSEVWGYDYYGGTRTVDVHIRRLRAKLGAEYDTCIGTVRNVGYRFTPK